MTQPEPNAIALPAATLGYASADTRPPVPRAWRTVALRIVLGCWAVPLSVGTVAFVALLVSPADGRGQLNDFWASVASCNLFIGIALAAVGGVAILVFAATRWAATAGDRWRQLVGPALLATALLASNFVVAFFMIVVVLKGL